MVMAKMVIILSNCCWHPLWKQEWTWGKNQI